MRKRPTEESTKEALEARSTEHKENFPGILSVENQGLYNAARKFKIPLPRKKTENKLKHPGNEILEQLIIKCEATLSLISDSLFKNQGIKVSTSEISKWIGRDKKLRELAKEMRRARNIRIAEERFAERVLEYPGKEELKQLISENDGYQFKMINSLREQGMRVTGTTLFKLIDQDEELSGLIREVRQARNIRIAEERATKLALEYPDKEELKQLIREYKANATQIANFLKKQGKKVHQNGILKLINQDEELRELARELRGIRKIRIAEERTVRRTLEYPGKEELKQLIRENDGHQLKMIIFLRKQGRGVAEATISKWIREDEELRELVREIRQARNIRKAEERATKLALEYPDKEELKQLIREYKANATQIANFLKKQGKKVRLDKILRLINQDEELRELAREIREVRVTVNYPGPKREKPAPQIKKPVAKKEPEYLPEATAKQEKDLPLSKEEIEMLSVYQEGDSLEVLINKTKIPGGRVGILITSILARKHVATLSEAKEKSKEELVTA